MGTGRVTDVDSPAASGPPLHARRSAIKTHTSVNKAFAKLGLKGGGEHLIHLFSPTSYPERHM